MSSPLDGNGVATADIAAPVIRFVIFVSWGNDDNTEGSEGANG